MALTNQYKLLHHTTDYERQGQGQQQGDQLGGYCKDLDKRNQMCGLGGNSRDVKVVRYTIHFERNTNRIY